MCFVLENDHDFKSCQNMSTTLRFFFGIICYKFVLDTIYIALHLHVIKDSSPLNRPKIENKSNYKFLMF